METESEKQSRLGSCGTCDNLDKYFKKSGRWWYTEGTDGMAIPILFCPVCGKRINGRDE